MGVGSRLRSLCVVLGLCAAVWLLVSQLDTHYPVKNWLFWRYAAYWLVAGAWSLCCTMGGLRLVEALSPRGTALRERLVLAFPCGVLLFFLVMFVAGLCGLLRPWFAVVCPLLVAAGGARSSVRLGRRAIRHVRAARRRPQAPLPLWYPFAFAGAVLAFVIVYAGVMLPENAAYDSRWYHLPIAEHYAAEGAIRPSPEGWFSMALPHLSSVLYTWPYLFRGLPLFDQVEIAAHMELMAFLWTLAGVPVLVRWVVRGARARLAWAAIFLFPGIFIYDSGLSLAADHIAAMWAIPIYLALRRAYRDLSPRSGVLLGAMLAGALLTKYQSAMLMAFPVPAIAARGLWVAGRRLVESRRKGLGPSALAASVAPPMLGVLAVALSVLVLTSPHWLKNFVFYGDPVYPFLHAQLDVRPASEEALEVFRRNFDEQVWAPIGTTAEKLKETGTALFTFSFIPHDWAVFHGVVPVFGFLFTLTLLFAPFLGKSARLWGVLAAGHVGLFTWYWMSHQDRYLQALLPWLVVAVASGMALVWRLGYVHRAALTILVIMQAVWAGSVWCIPSHAYLGLPLTRAIAFVRSGLSGERTELPAIFGDFPPMSEVLPRRAKVLVHNEHVHAGLRRMAVRDWAGWQGGIGYREYRSPSALHEFFRRLRVTHLVWPGIGYAHESLASELRFLSFATHYTEDIRTFGSHRLGTVPERPPIDPPREPVLYLACTGYTPGLYELNDLQVVSRAPPPDTKYPAPREAAPGSSRPDIEPLLARALFVIRNTGCNPNFDVSPAQHGFVHVKNRGPEEVWIRQQL